MPIMQGDLFYFAYGSNLDRQQMEKRTGPILGAQRANLLGYRLAFNKRAASRGVYANIVPHLGDEVWGVLYPCTPEALDKMDCYEGVAAGHYRRSRVTLEVEDGRWCPA